MASAFSLAHHSVFDSDTIYNNLSLPLTNIVNFTYCRQPHDSKTHLPKRDFHTLTNNVLFPSLANIGSINYLENHI